MSTADEEAPPSPSMIFTRNGLRRGAKALTPISIGVFAYSIIFGALARAAGLTVGEVALMSATVFSGSAQFLIIGIWNWPVPVLGVLLATTIIGLRHILLGAALRPYLGNLSPRRAYGSLYLLTDENWAVALRAFRTGERDAAYLLGGGLALFASWVSGTVLGRLLGALISDPDRWGLDFAFTAVFVGLLLSLWRDKHDLLPWIIAGGVALAAERLLPGQWYIILGALAGSGFGAWRHAD